MNFSIATIIAVYSTLVLFGIGYNLAVSLLERKGWLHGYVWFAVAGGVLVTIALTAFISPLHALVTLGAFVSSGIPMILGSIYRHVTERERVIRALQLDAYDQAEDMA